MSLIVSVSPDNLLPKVGDVLIGFCSELRPDLSYFDSFGIKVTRCSYDSRRELWEVAGKEVDKLSDVFTKFVSTERLIYTPDGKAVRRMAGLKTLATRSDGSGSLDLINLQGALTREFQYGSDSNLAMTIDYGIRAGISVTYDIDMDHFFVRMATDQELSAQIGFGGTLGAKWEPDLGIAPDWLTSIKFPACLPIFETQPVPSLFFRTEAKLSLKSTLPKVGFKSKQLVIISDRTGNWLNCKCSTNLLSGYGEDEEKLIQPGDARFAFDGYLQAGVKFEAKIKTNSWTKKLFQSAIGLDMYVGPKFSGHLDFSVKDIAEKKVYYSSLKNSKLTFEVCAIDVEAKANLNVWGFPDKEEKFGEAGMGFGKKELYAVADVQLKNQYADSKNNTITANLKWKNDVLFGHSVGFAVFKKNNPEWGLHEEDECVYDNSWFHFRGEKEKEFVTPQLKAGSYYYSPYVTFLGEKVFMQNKEVSFGPIVKFDVDTISIAATGKDGFVRTVIHYECDDDIVINSSVMFNQVATYTHNYKLSDVSIDYDAKTITISVPDNKRFFNLTGTVRLTARLKTGSPEFSIWLPFRQDANTSIKAVKIHKLLYDNVQCTYSELYMTDGEVTEGRKDEYTTPAYIGAYKDFIPCTTSFRNNKLTITGKAENENEAVEMRAVFTVLDDKAELNSFSSSYIGTEVRNGSTITTTESIKVVNDDHHPYPNSSVLISDSEEHSLTVGMEKNNCTVTYRQVEEGTEERYGKTEYHKFVTDKKGLLDNPDYPTSEGSFKFKN